MSARTVSSIAMAALLGACAGEREYQGLGFDQERLYAQGWSAQEMIDTQVRAQGGDELGEVEDIVVGSEGQIQSVVVASGGVLDVGKRHVAVPWEKVRIGREMSFVQVALHPRAGKSGESVPLKAGEWKVSELLGDTANLRDLPAYGHVTDVIFSPTGKAEAVVVQSNRGPWTAFGPYAYPFVGYNMAWGAYPLGYNLTQVQELTPFDYEALGRESEYAEIRRDAAAGR